MLIFITLARSFCIALHNTEAVRSCFELLIGDSSSTLAQRGICVVLDVHGCAERIFPGEHSTLHCDACALHVTLAGCASRHHWPGVEVLQQALEARFC